MEGPVSGCRRLPQLSGAQLARPQHKQLLQVGPIRKAAFNQSCLWCSNNPEFLTLSDVQFRAFHMLVFWVCWYQPAILLVLILMEEVHYMNNFDKTFLQSRLEYGMHINPIDAITRSLASLPSTLLQWPCALDESDTA